MLPVAIAVADVCLANHESYTVADVARLRSQKLRSPNNSGESGYKIRSLEIPMNSSLLRTYPVTITVSVIALLAWASPTLSLWLQLDFNAVADGQWWRIWTGHLTHYDGNHLFWDLIMFAVLGGACEHRHPRPFASAIAVMIAVISASIASFCDQVSVYRGLSGIDTGLFVWFVADQCHDCWRSRDRVSAMIWLSLSMGLIGKLLYEITTGQILLLTHRDLRRWSNPISPGQRSD